MQVTPLLLEIVLWYSYAGDEFPHIHSSAAQRTILDLRAADVMYKRPDNDPAMPRWALTERGRRWVAALQRVPLPRAQWVIDWPQGPEAL